MIPLNFFKDKRILITGASSGIGETLAIVVSSLGASVIITGRSIDRLNAVASRCMSPCTVVSGDLSLPSTISEISQSIQIQFNGQLDIAILNAGNNKYVSANDFDSAPFYDLMKDNFFTMVDCISCTLPFLKKSKGQLVLVSSLAAYGGLPLASAYGASKAAIRNMAQSLDLELRPLGIPVTCICPGFVKTPLTDLNTFKMPGLVSTEFATEKILKGIKKKSHEVFFPTPFSLFMKILMSLPSKIQYYVCLTLTSNKS